MKSPMFEAGKRAAFEAEYEIAQLAERMKRVYEVSQNRPMTPREANLFFEGFWEVVGGSQ